MGEVDQGMTTHEVPPEIADLAQRWTEDQRREAARAAARRAPRSARGRLFAVAITAIIAANVDLDALYPEDTHQPVSADDEDRLMAWVRAWLVVDRSANDVSGDVAWSVGLAAAEHAGDFGITETQAHALFVVAGGWKRVSHE